MTGAILTQLNHPQKTRLFSFGVFTPPRRRHAPRAGGGAWATTPSANYLQTPPVHAFERRDKKHGYLSSSPTRRTPRLDSRPDQVVVNTLDSLVQSLKHGRHRRPAASLERATAWHFDFASPASPNNCSLCRGMTKHVTAHNPGEGFPQVNCSARSDRSPSCPAPLVFSVTPPRLEHLIPLPCTTPPHIVSIHLPHHALAIPHPPGHPPPPCPSPPLLINVTFDASASLIVVRGDVADVHPPPSPCAGQPPPPRPSPTPMPLPIPPHQRHV